MTDNQAQTPPTTNSGTLETKPIKRRGRPAKTTTEAPLDVAQELTATTEDRPAEFFDPTQAVSLMPIASLRDLETQVALALSQGVKELEVTKEVMSQLLKGSYSDTNNSIIYRNVWLFEVGKKDETKKKLNENLNRRLHGKSGLKGRG